MFRKVMVADRGEIAVRIIHACRELGIKTAAVYSEGDRRSLHVRLADEAICIGPDRLNESYLNIRTLFAAAELTKADAIHPGYSLLSQDADFAAACEDCHLQFIGPSPDVLALLSRKEKARCAIKKINVSVLPGSDSVITSVLEAKGVAAQLGYPVMVKASGGCGGQGVRPVRTPSDMEQLFLAAQSEALTAFGHSTLYLEKFIERARLIECQVIGDAYGNVVSVGERECSIQSHYRTLLHESLGPTSVGDCCRQTVHRVTKYLSALGYQSAGTVEFLLDEDDCLYFIEVNPRIQMERAVTEMVTGLDLVKLQILLADGAKLEEVVPCIEGCGHSIACRINAESPKTLIPSSGKIEALNMPGGPGVRIDIAVSEQEVVPPSPDSLLAKVVVHAENREQAIERMRQVLDNSTVEGVETTIPLHQRILGDARFKAGSINTRYIEEMLEGCNRTCTDEKRAGLARQIPCDDR